MTEQTERPRRSNAAFPDAEFRTAEFRNALGSFATGVTIVTTLDEAGQPIGVTVNSFNSVSLDPPLVLWSLAKDSLSFPAFSKAGHFAVHVLTDSQRDLARRFARSGENKFSDIEWQGGVLGSPLLADHASRFECRTQHQYEGGDHVIMVGEVTAFHTSDAAPLLYHAGQFANLAEQ
jgi:3-hydroxy-9,10-secoandrosta-1,3,5(10)-triene-9,17-dione monooxygenase reductase component